LIGAISVFPLKKAATVRKEYDGLAPKMQSLLSAQVEKATLNVLLPAL
jgi:hypothetical protein